MNRRRASAKASTATTRDPHFGFYEEKDNVTAEPPAQERRPGPGYCLLVLEMRPTGMDRTRAVGSTCNTPTLLSSM